MGFLMIFMIEVQAVLLLGSVQYMDPDYLGRLWLRSWASFDPRGVQENSLGGGRCMACTEFRFCNGNDLIIIN